mgnify:CR=1 FL=1
MSKFEYTNNYYHISKLLSLSIDKLSELTNSKVKKKNCLNLYNNQHLNFYKKELTVLASRPSMGKTALALNWTREFAANQNKSVGFISAGIPDSETLFLRLLSLESKIYPTKIRRGFLSVNDLEKIQNACKKLYNLPIFISDIPNSKFEDIESIATDMVNKNKIEILFIDGFDYIYEIAVSKKLFCEGAIMAENLEPYYNEINFMMDNFKYLASELKIPIVLLLSVKPNVYGSTPTIASFEDKLAIPKIADKVIFLHRERDNYPSKWHNAEVIIAKDSHNPSGHVNLEFNMGTGKFRCQKK